ncbi:MAG: glycoside hydrolase family 16 protein [Treponema sp.]|nr:glycoside hydrolase family 16 protein [Treponema sp.]
MKKIILPLLIFITLLNLLSAGPSKVKNKNLTVKAKKEGLLITKKHDPLFTRITIHVEGPQGENFSISTDNKNNTFLYPFVKEGSSYNVYLVMMDKNWGNWTKSPQVTITAQGGLGDLSLSVPEYHYDSKNCKVIFDKYNFTSPIEALSPLYSGNIYWKFQDGKIDYSQSDWGFYSFQDNQLSLESVYDSIAGKTFALHLQATLEYKGLNYILDLFHNKNNPFKDNHLVKSIELQDGVLNSLYRPEYSDYKIYASPEKVSLKIETLEGIKDYTLDFSQASKQTLEVICADQKEILTFERPLAEYIEFQGKKYTQVFYDDFQGNDLDLSKWRRAREEERQPDMENHGFWSNECSYLDGKGNLVIDAKVDQSGRKLSGAIESQGIFEQSHGYYEVKFKCDNSSGLWYAFWLMGHNDVEHIGNGAVDGAEIDVFELVPNEENQGPGYFNSTIHWDAYGPEHKNKSAPGIKVAPDFYDQWHIAQFIWGQTSYDFYLDGELLWSMDASKNDEEGYGGMCQKKNWIIISSEFGSWGGPFQAEYFPSKMLIDYVKVGKES